MCHMRKTTDRDDKLEQIMRLREYQQNNSTHVNTMAGIMSPDGGYGEGSVGEGGEGPEAYRGFYGRLRLVLCLLLFGFLCMYHFKMEPEDGTFTKELQAAVRIDYSDKVIDFMKDFTYTLDYEKTSLN